MRFLQLDLDNALSLDPEAEDWTGRRLVRLIAGNPVTMGQMTRHVPAAARRTGHHPHRGNARRRRPRGLRLRGQRDRSLSQCCRVRGRQAPRRRGARLLREATEVQAPAAP